VRSEGVRPTNKKHWAMLSVARMVAKVDGKILDLFCGECALNMLSIWLR
jgi:hypothetical protein